MERAYRLVTPCTIEDESTLHRVSVLHVRNGGPASFPCFPAENLCWQARQRLQSNELRGICNLKQFLLFDLTSQKAELKYIHTNTIRRILI